LKDWTEGFWELGALPLQLLRTMYCTRNSQKGTLMLFFF
jgi:hypothetical protein